MHVNKVIQTISGITINNIQKVTDCIDTCVAKGGKVILAGNGGSSSIASHMAQDLIKRLNIPAICLSDNVPALTAYSNDEDYNLAFVDIANVLCNRSDLFILLTTSGNSVNIHQMCYEFSRYKIVVLTADIDGRMKKDHKYIELIKFNGSTESVEDGFSVFCHAVIENLDAKKRPVSG